MNNLNDREYFVNLPRKVTSSSALFFNKKEEILILKPSYKNHWVFPGGTTEEKESPKEACEREVLEEIRLHNIDFKFIGIAYVNALRCGSFCKPDNIILAFYGGILSQSQIKTIRVDHDEIIDYKFVNIFEAQKLLSPRVAQALPKYVDAINNQKPIYLEINKN